MVAPAIDRQDHDTDSFRMTIGEHLEELRRRFIYGLIGLAVALGCVLPMGDALLKWFCRPLTSVLEAKHLTPQLQYTELGEPFMVWMRVSLIAALAIAGPWMLFQIWLFVASGLYPRERRYVTRYAPLSVVLLLTGMAFVYFFVLPWSVEFLIDWGNTVGTSTTQLTAPQSPSPTTLQSFKGDPVDPVPNQIWFDSASGRVKLFVDGSIRSIRLSSDSLLTPDIKLDEYISLVVAMLLAFGLSFQLPLVVVALVRVGVVEMDQLRAGRRYVYLVLSIAAAAITPGSDISSMVGLTIPLILLYELGLWLAKTGPAPSSEMPDRL